MASRPRVSNDNAYAESLFRTAKCCPMWPKRPFVSVEQATVWVLRFVAWYNEEHRHSALKYVTPDQRHKGQDKELLDRRAQLYEKARQANPQRWSSDARNWQLEDAVYLNPERAARDIDKQAA